MPATPLLVGAVLTGLAACATDLRSRRIPNALTLGAVPMALASWIALEGPAGVLWSAGGWLVGMLVFLPLFAVRGLGGGDVKLMGAFGAWLGPMLVVWTGLFGAIAGGVLAIAVALFAGYAKQTYRNVWLMLTHWRVAGFGAVATLTLDDAKGPKLAYAIPLTCGLGMAIWLKG